MTTKDIIYNALVGDTTLVNLVGLDAEGNPKIYTSWHDSQRGYPQITINRVSDSSGYSGDNTRRYDDSLFQVDIWSRTDPTTIEEALINVLKVVGTYPTSPIGDSFDPDEALHRVTRQTTILQLKEVVS